MRLSLLCWTRLQRPTNLAAQTSSVQDWTNLPQQYCLTTKRGHGSGMLPVERYELIDLGGEADQDRLAQMLYELQPRLRNREVIVLDLQIGQTQVVNYSYPDPWYLVVVPVHVANGTDVDKVRKIMVDTVRQVRSVVSLKHSEDRAGSQLEPHSGKPCWQHSPQVCGHSMVQRLILRVASD